MKNIRQNFFRWLSSFLLAIAFIFNFSHVVIEHIHYDAKSEYSVSAVAAKRQEVRIKKKTAAKTVKSINKTKAAFRTNKDESVYKPISFRIWLYAKLYQADYLALSPLIIDNNYQWEREGFIDVWNNRHILF